MKALALVAALSLTFTLAAKAQDSKQSLKSNGGTRQGAEAAANIDVGAIQKKIDEYTEAIKNDPKNDKYYGARGQNYIRVGKLDRAIADLTMATSLNPGRQAYFEVRGDAFAKLKRNREAFDDYGRALGLGAPSHYLYRQRACVAVLLDNYKEAETAAKAALELKPGDSHMLGLMGGVERELGKLQQSLKFYSDAIAVDPSNAYLLRQRATTYSQLGKKELANNDLAMSKKLDSANR